MKRFTIICGIAALIMASACSKINEKENQTSSQTITCIAPNDGTKSYVDGLNVKWQEGDQVIVIDNGYITEVIEKGNTIVENDNAYYQLSSGANTTSAKFTKKSGRNITAGTNVTAFSFKKYYWVGNKYYYDIPNNPELVAYSAPNASPVQQYVPMIAKNIQMGDPFVFEHLASAIRLKITNNYGTPVTITEITISSDQASISGRRELNPADWSEKIYATYKYNIISSGTVALEVGETKFVDFIVSKETQTNLKVMISTNVDKKFVYKKASFTPQVGKIHSFATSLDNTHLHTAGYTISIDGADFVPYDIEGPFPSTPTTSVVLKSNDGVQMDKSGLELLTSKIKGLSTTSIDVDLRGVETAFTEFPQNVMTVLGTKLNNLYLPLTVTSLPAYGAILTGCTNAKLHIHKNITKVGWIQWGGTIVKGNALNDEAGFYVDGDNPYYSAKDGVLYSKPEEGKEFGETLIERIAFKTDGEGTVVIPEGVTTLDQYALSNHKFVLSYTFPSTLTTFKSDVFYSTAALVEMVFKSPNPPTLGCALNDNTGYIIIDTGDKEQDNASLALYQSAWAGKLKNWTIKTKAAVQTTQNAVIDNLSSNNEYSNNLW